jgi:hypothetical protein
MKARLRTAAWLALALAAAGCQVNVDENTAAQLDNAADRIGNVAEDAAAGAENAAEDAAATVESAADRIENVDVDVHTGVGNDSAANRQ